MAHIGKIFKLLFRRDLCLGCTNYRRAFPEAWRVSFSAQQEGLDPLVFVLNATLCLRTSPDASNTPEWQTEEVTVTGRTFRVVISWSHWEFATQRTWVRYSIVASGTERLHILMRNGTIGDCSNYLSAGFPYLDVITDDPAYWGGRDVIGNFSASAATWQHWP